MKSLVILICLLVAVRADTTPFQNCDDGPPPLSLRIQDCPKLPCTFYRGTNVSAEWDFTVVKTTQQLKPRVRATAYGVTVDYPYPQKNACVTLKNAECPLDKDEEVTYSMLMPILKTYPTIPVVIEFAFLGDNNEVQVCYRVNAKVANPPKYFITDNHIRDY